ncbi:MAG: hypothetical protein HGA27_00325 [Peptococcaceae bacterium]|nr:hypothetical protein [Peptococcaceae bacterium]
MSRQIGRLIGSSCPKALKGATLDETGIRAGRHDETLNVLCELQMLIENKKKTEEGFAEINNILLDISQDDNCEHYGKVLRMWYIERLSKEVIAEELFCGIRTVYYLRDAAIRKFAIRLFGIDALKVV